MRIFRNALALLLACGSAAHAVPAAAPLASYEALTQRASARPDDLMAGNALRRWCREQKKTEECVAFFDKLVAAHPDSPGARYNAALAYIDRLPGHSLLMQAKLSTSSIGHATAVTDRKPDDWLALYIRGLNNLYWPKWYRRAGRTAVDMQHLIDITASLPPAEKRPYMALAYVALGDAYVLLDEPQKAQETWRQGAALFNSPGLQQRLALPASTLEREIEAIRSRERPIDTDLSFYTHAGSEQR